MLQVMKEKKKVEGILSLKLMNQRSITTERNQYFKIFSEQIQIFIQNMSVI